MTNEEIQQRKAILIEIIDSSTDGTIQDMVDQTFDPDDSFENMLRTYIQNIASEPEYRHQLKKCGGSFNTKDFDLIQNEMESIWDILYENRDREDC